MRSISNKFRMSSIFMTAVALLAGLGISSQLSAHGGASGIVKERMDRMQVMKESMAVMGDMVKGKTPFLAGEVKKQAQLIIEASKGLPETFPMGSMHGPTEALPAIWHEWDRFVSLSGGLDEQAAKLEQIASESDKKAVKIQYVKLAKACRACHTDYRKKKAEG